jgi:hypothetical protein
MDATIMNILAYLAILALVGLFVVIAWGLSTVMAMVRKVKGSVAIINPPRQSIIQIIGVGKGIGLRVQQRGLAIAGHAKVAAASVMHAKDEIASVAKTIDVAGAKASVQETAETFKQVTFATEILRVIMATVRQAHEAERS